MDRNNLASLNRTYSQLGSFKMLMAPVLLPLLFLLLLPGSAAAKMVKTGLRGEIHSTKASVIVLNERTPRMMHTFHKILRALPEDKGALVVTGMRFPHKPFIYDWPTDIKARFVSGQFKILLADSDSFWARDFFPQVTLGKDGKKRFVSFTYLPEQYREADRLSYTIARRFGLDHYRSPLNGEWGNIMVDDRGTLFATTKWLSRNKAYTKSQVEEELKQALGAKKVVWVPKMNERRRQPTHHVDMMGKLVWKRDPATGKKEKLVAVVGESTLKKTGAPLDWLARRFTKDGRHVYRLKNADFDHELGVYPYVNSQLIGRRALVPQFGDPTLKRGACADEDFQKNTQRLELDQRAVELFKSLGYEVHQIPVRDLLRNHAGAVHCLTSQLSHEVPAF